MVLYRARQYQGEGGGVPTGEGTVYETQWKEIDGSDNVQFSFTQLSKVHIYM